VIPKALVSYMGGVEVLEAPL
jgi:hypothetical protein